MADKITTVSIYAADLEWLQNRQLRTARPKQWPHMADVMRALIETVKQSEEANEGA